MIKPAHAEEAGEEMLNLPLGLNIKKKFKVAINTPAVARIIVVYIYKFYLSAFNKLGIFIIIYC